MAVTLRVHRCTTGWFTASNPLINGGLFDGHLPANIDLVGRCNKAQADTAFLFFAFAAFVATTVLSGMAGRRKGVRAGAVV